MPQKDMICAKVERVAEKLNIEEDEKYQAVLRLIKKKFSSYCSVVNIVNKDVKNIIKGENDLFKLFTIPESPFKWIFSKIFSVF